MRVMRCAWGAMPSAAVMQLAGGLGPWARRKGCLGIGRPPALALLLLLLLRPCASEKDVT